jgi:hypothetical protein
MTDAPFRYRLFGLTVASEVHLPELLPDHGASEPALINIVLVSAIDGPSDPGLHAIPGGALLNIEETARFAVTGGTTIRIAREPGAPERNLRVFLLGSAMGLLIHQRELLPLHANAVEIDGHAVAFMGVSGAGKSTLAAWFLDRGHRIIADDVCVIQFDAQGRALALPGLPRLRLWRDVLHSTGRSPADYPASFLGDDAPDKFDVPVAHDCAVEKALPLAAVYLLGQGEDGGIAALEGTAALEAIFANTYRGAYLDTNGSAVTHWKTALRLTASVPVFQAIRRWGWDQYDQEAQQLRAHALSLGAP